MKKKECEVSFKLLSLQDEGSSVLLKRDRLRDLRKKINDAQERNDPLAEKEARAEFKEIESQIFEDYNRFQK